MATCKASNECDNKQCQMETTSKEKIGDVSKQEREIILGRLLEKGFATSELVAMAKSDKDSASIVKEIIMSRRESIDETDLADKITREIIDDIEHYVDAHLRDYSKFTLTSKQAEAKSLQENAKFFNLIGLLRDVSVLGRKLLESMPRFETLRPKSTLDSLSSGKLLAEAEDVRCSWSLIGEDATSEDLLAALIESSSSDDFLVLSSSLDTISVRDMTLAVHILTKSHECFTLAHDIQGVVIVLRRAKFMILNILAPKNQMELVTKLLTSIGRYREMNYVFDLFRDRNQFELLLSKGVEKTPELRIALFNYVKRNPEFYALVTLNFSMFREIAESFEASASNRLEKLVSCRQAAPAPKQQEQQQQQHQQHQQRQQQQQGRRVSKCADSGVQPQQQQKQQQAHSSGRKISIAGDSDRIRWNSDLQNRPPAGREAARAAATSGCSTSGNNAGAESLSFGISSASISKSQRLPAQVVAAGSSEQRRRQVAPPPLGRHDGDAERGDYVASHTGAACAWQTTTAPAARKTTDARKFVPAAGAEPRAAALAASGAPAPADCDKRAGLYSRDALDLCLVELVDASDCYAKAGCYKRASHCARQARLVALQLALLPSGTNLLKLRQFQLSEIIVGFELCANAVIVAEAYNYQLAWRQALFKNVVLASGRLGGARSAARRYLDHFCNRCELSAALVAELVILYKQHLQRVDLGASARAAAAAAAAGPEAGAHCGASLEQDYDRAELARAMRLIIERLGDVETKFRLYSQLSLFEAREELLRDAATRAYLSDLKLVE